MWIAGNQMSGLVFWICGGVFGMHVLGSSLEIMYHILLLLLPISVNVACWHTGLDFADSGSEIQLYITQRDNICMICRQNGTIIRIWNMFEGHSAQFGPTPLIVKDQKLLDIT